jgi:hypothetical protein
MTATALARTRLYDALVPRFAGTGVNVERVRPPELAVPVCYLDVAGRRFDNVDGAPVVVVVIPVVIIVDGANEEQVAQLDDLGDDVWWVALELTYTPVGSFPATIDVDGPTLRGSVTNVEVDVDHLTLCPDPTP